MQKNPSFTHCDNNNSQNPNELITINKTQLEAIPITMLDENPVKDYDCTTKITEKSIRRGFLHKVLMIIFCQMLISIFFVLCSVFITAFREFQTENVFLIIIAIFVEIFLFFLMICNPKICRKVPINYFILFVFTIAVSYILSFTCARTKPEAILVATISTTVIVALIAFWSFFTTKDLTTKIGFYLYLPVAAIILILFLSMWRSYITQIVISLIFVGLFSAFLAFDLQRVSGKFGVEYSIDDYVFAALTIYIDIILIFKTLLAIFGSSK